MFNLILMSSAKLYLASKLIEKVMLDRVQCARYIKALIAIIYGTSRPRVYSPSFLGQKGSFLTSSDRTTDMDELYPCESVSRLSLCRLTDEQEFHLEGVQFVSQDKILFYHDLSSQTHSLSNQRFL